jgi:hypothetical protein
MFKNEAMVSKEGKEEGREGGEKRKGGRREGAIKPIITKKKGVCTSFKMSKEKNQVILSLTGKNLRSVQLNHLDDIGHIGQVDT